MHPAQNSSFQKAVKNRINQLNLPKAVRKDAVVMAQVLVTSDHDFFADKSSDEIRNFFSECYNFLAARYGLENVISSMVHLDERTPHMHFNFVPVTSDGRLSAKDILTKKSLIEQQTAFFEQVGKRYDLKRGIQGSKEKHLETAEYKQQKALEHAKKVEQDILYLEMDKNALEAAVGDLKSIVKEIENLPDGKKAKIGQNILLKPEEYQMLRSAAMGTKWKDYEKKEMQRKIERLEKRNQELESKSLEKELKEQNQQLKAENKKFMEQVGQLTWQRQKIYQAIDCLPISDQQKEQTKLGISSPIKRNLDFER